MTQWNPHRMGNGCSSGSGAYKYYKNVQTKEMLRLDPAKGTLLPPFSSQ